MSITNRRSSALAALLIMGIALSACSDANEKIRGWLDQIIQTQRPGNAASSNYPILAKVGSEEIRRSDIASYLLSRTDLVQAAKTPEGRRQVLQGLIWEKTLSQLARNAGIPDDPAYLAARKRYEDMGLQNFYIDRLRSEIRVSSADVRAYYDAHPAEFSDGVIHASRIVTKTHEQAERARAQLAKNVPFGKVAKAFSTDKISVRAGGKLPPVHPEQLAPELVREYRALKRGEISNIMKTAGGFQFIRKDAEMTGPLKPFASVQDLILSKLTLQKLNERIDAAKSAIPVVLYEDQLKM